jgi:hypothetical protein
VAALPGRPLRDRRRRRRTRPGGSRGPGSLRPLRGRDGQPLHGGQPAKGGGGRRRPARLRALPAGPRDGRLHGLRERREPLLHCRNGARLRRFRGSRHLARDPGQPGGQASRLVPRAGRASVDRRSAPEDLVRRRLDARVPRRRGGGGLREPHLLRARRAARSDGGEGDLPRLPCPGRRGRSPGGRRRPDALPAVRARPGRRSALGREGLRVPRQRDGGNTPGAGRRPVRTGRARRPRGARVGRRRRLRDRARPPRGRAPRRVTRPWLRPPGRAGRPRGPRGRAGARPP